MTKCKAGFLKFLLFSHSDAKGEWEVLKVQLCTVKIAILQISITLRHSWSSVLKIDRITEEIKKKKISGKWMHGQADM